MTPLYRPASTGSAQMQGELWSARARDYAELQEGLFPSVIRERAAPARTRERAIEPRYRLRSRSRRASVLRRQLPTSPASMHPPRSSISRVSACPAGIFASARWKRCRTRMEASMS